MEDHALQVEAKIQIMKPVHEVFEAIIDPAKMSNYFIEQGSGKIEEGKVLYWKFPEFDEAFPVTAGKIEQNKYISFTWEVEKNLMLVEMTLNSAASAATVVTVTEKAMNNSEVDIKWLKSNTEGWANFLACLKAYLEYGINLRKGAFDFLKS